MFRTSEVVFSSVVRKNSRGTRDSGALRVVQGVHEGPVRRLRFREAAHLRGIPAPSRKKSSFLEPEIPTAKRTGTANISGVSSAAGRVAGELSDNGFAVPKSAEIFQKRVREPAVNRVARGNSRTHRDDFVTKHLERPRMSP